MRHAAKRSNSAALISVVICTYGRAAALQNLLQSLALQTNRDFEILVVDGNGEVSPARDTVDCFLAGLDVPMRLAILKSPEGLTRQRNAGIAAAQGSLICFLDDDVTFEADFLEEVADLFEEADTQDVGGITAYDVLNYPTRVTLRWRLRCLLGVVPSLKPGDADHLGRDVSLGFLPPWNGRKEVRWLSGFCMIYRRAAIGELRFDEVLPTYAGEDLDFSMRVGRHWRLLFCGALSIRHHYSAEGRDDQFERLRQSSFGAGRRFAQNAQSFGDYLTAAQTFLGDFAVDTIGFMCRPNRGRFTTLIVRMRAFVTGWRSIRNENPRRCAPLLKANRSERQNSVSGAS